MSRKFLSNTRFIVVFQRNFASNKNLYNMCRQNMGCVLVYRYTRERNINECVTTPCMDMKTIRIPPCAGTPGQPPKHASAVVLSKTLENKMAEIYRCAVGPQLYRIFTKNSRQVSVEWTLFHLENSI